MQDHLVLVFDDERSGFDSAIAALLKSTPEALADETADLESCRASLDVLRTKYLGSVMRNEADVLFDLFQIAWHIAQGQRAPDFFAYEAPKDHDLDAIARDFIRRDLRMSETKALLESEYVRKDRFWRTLFPRYEQFRSFYDACVARDSTAEVAGPAPKALPPPASREPTEEEKAQVIRRDGGKCLACGATKNLEADHIVGAYHGGSNHIDNLQTLCKTCNGRKRTQTMRFGMQTTTLTAAPEALANFDDPRDAGDRDHWERFLRRTLNFTFQCAAVASVVIGGRGPTYYNWTVELFGGNSLTWLAPHLPELFERIQQARRGAGKADLESLTLSAPGQKPLRVPR